MIKTIAITALTAIAIVSTAHASDAGIAAKLPPTFIVYKLAQDGIPLRELETEGSIYKARVVATDGSIVKVGIDPQTAELTDDYSRAPTRPADGPAPKVDAAQAIQAVAATGYWDIRDVEFKTGRWEIKSSNEDGHRAKFTVDGMTGVVK